MENKGTIMTRHLRLSVALGALLALQAIAPRAQAAIPSVARHDLLVLRAGAWPVGSLATLSVGTGQATHALPLGLFSRDGHTLYVAAPQPDGAHSLVQAIDAASGRTLRSLTVAGNYTTQAGNYTPATFYGTATAATPPGTRSGQTGSPLDGHPAARLAGGYPVDTSETLTALSFNGRWLALRDATPGARDTHAIMIDTATLRVAATVRLAGHFGLDAINADGSALYLIEPLAQRGPHAYQVRLYDVRQGRLATDPLREPGEREDIIRGTSYTRVWSPRGDWLFTLYVQPGHSGAFVHALGVADRRVHCIMLPDDHAAAADLAHYMLAVAPDGTSLYLVNPVLGRAITVHGLPIGMAAEVSLATRAGAPQHTLTGAVVSPDGRTLFAATSQGVWVLPTRALGVRATDLAGRAVASIAPSPDGQRLYALEPERGLVAVIDPASGHVSGTMRADTGTWAIERVMRAR